MKHAKKPRQGKAPFAVYSFFVLFPFSVTRWIRPAGASLCSGLSDGGDGSEPTTGGDPAETRTY